MVHEVDDMDSPGGSWITNFLVCFRLEVQLQLAFLTMAKICRFWGTVCPR